MQVLDGSGDHWLRDRRLVRLFFAFFAFSAAKEIHFNEQCRLGFSDDLAPMMFLRLMACRILAAKNRTREHACGPGTPLDGLGTPSDGPGTHFKARKSGSRTAGGGPRNSGRTQIGKRPNPRAVLNLRGEFYPGHGVELPGCSSNFLQGSPLRSDRLAPFLAGSWQFSSCLRGERQAS